MLFLLACAAPPGIDLPVVPPAAVNATAVPAASFVGPLAVDGLDATALCGAPDLPALLAAGHFGWRVLLAAPEGVRPYDVPLPSDAPEELARERTRERLKQWVAADAKVAQVCGAPVSTPVVLAVDGAGWCDAEALFASDLDVRLLVADPEPGLPVPAPATRAEGPYLMLAGGGKSWALLGSSADVKATEHVIDPNAPRRALGEAVARIGALGNPAVVLATDGSSSRLAEGLDALAGVGIVPTLGLMVGGAAPARAALPGTRTRVVIGQTLAVLPLEPPDYAPRPGGPLHLMMIGTRDAHAQPAPAEAAALDAAPGAPPPFPGVAPPEPLISTPRRSPAR